MRRKNWKHLILIPLTALSVAVLTGVAPAQDDAVEKEASLYERLGGVYSIATVVDELIERLLVSEILNANPLIDEARKQVPKAGVKFRLTALICQLSGGPEVYNGRSMKDAHGHLNINEEQWNEMVQIFVATLNDLKVPEKEQGELLALVGPTKTDIVTATE